MARRRRSDTEEIPRRLGERFVGGFFRSVTRVSGLRPSLVPAHMRRQLQVVGIYDEQLARVLANIKRLGDWPYAWEAEGDRQAAQGNWALASASYHVAQRVLITDSPLKRRLYTQARELYMRIDQPPLEHLRVTTPEGETVAGYLQLPERATASPPPLVLMVAGVGSTKEELHPFAMPLLQRGYAVARIDNPGYGETTGVMNDQSRHNPAHVIRHLVQDPRIDGSTVHLFGMSLGAFWVLHTATEVDVRSVVVVAPPFEPDRFFHTLPAMNLTALQHMTGLDSYGDLVEYCRTLTLRKVAPRIVAPVLSFHGGRDRTVPVSESRSLGECVGGPFVLVEWERDHHNCLEHSDEIIAMTLEWFNDPRPAIAQYHRQLAGERSQRSADDAPGASSIDIAPQAT
jgi:pimeloyl-ACP methyl ester carboxylesterase